MFIVVVGTSLISTLTIGPFDDRESADTYAANLSKNQTEDFIYDVRELICP